MVGDLENRKRAQNNGVPVAVAPRLVLFNLERCFRIGDAQGDLRRTLLTEGRHVYTVGGHPVRYKREGCCTRQSLTHLLENQDALRHSGLRGINSQGS